MKISVRPMRLEDVPQVSEIEREAFPSQWPPTAYKRELQNRLARYLVAVEDGDTEIAQSPPSAVVSSPAESGEGVLSRIRHWFGREKLALPPTPLQPNQYLLGVVGLWLMVDEAHITTISVRESLRRRGIGELLLIKSIELAQELGAHVVTLEVRATNTGAQALYEKYGFHRVGLRRRYYSDNGEDALIMTTDLITLASYQAMFQRLREAHAQKWG